MKKIIENLANNKEIQKLPANGASPMYSSTQSVDALRSDIDELSEPLDAFNEWPWLMSISDEHGDKLFL